MAPLQSFALTPELVLFVFLPALIFESGINLNAKALMKDLAPVLTLAIPALLISTAFIGLGLWLLAPIGLMTALIFGALISATDPVAVVALFKELGAPQRLMVLVEGESLFNDATAIVLFKILLGIAAIGSFTFSDTGLAAIDFIEVFFGGITVGILSGILLSILLSLLTLNTAAVLTLSLVAAYLSFVLAEHSLHLSGVMAVVSLAITLGIFGIPKLNPDTTQALNETWEFLVLIANTLLFVLVGLSVDLANLISHTGLILIAVLLVQAARAGVIYSLVPLTIKAFKLPKVTIGEQHIMWWGGLKGGLAIAIVLSIPNDLPGKSLLIDLTLGVVLFTLLINASTIRSLIQYLGMNALTKEESAEVKDGLVLGQIKAEKVLKQFQAADLLTHENYGKIKRQTASDLMAEDIETDAKQNRKHIRLNALRVELETLNNLYQTGLIQQYNLLDLRGELERKREHVIQEKRSTISYQARRSNLFLRLEDALIQRLREQDWAIGLLASYQHNRLRQHLKKDIAKLFMAQSAVAYVKKIYVGDESEQAELDDVLKAYEGRLSFLRNNLNEIHREFPDFFETFLKDFSHSVALKAALNKTRDEAHHGVISAKAQNKIEGAISDSISSIKLRTGMGHDSDKISLIREVPLFHHLPKQALKALAKVSQEVTFLTGDTIIGQGERGDALYILSKGKLGVFKKDQHSEERQIATLGTGDFIGESGLLDKPVRTASVRALTASVLLRITSKQVHTLADKHPEITERLMRAKQERTDSQQDF